MSNDLTRANDLLKRLRSPRLAERKLTVYCNDETKLGKNAAKSFQTPYLTCGKHRYAAKARHGKLEVSLRVY